MMIIEPIHSDADHAAAHKRIEALMDAEPGTPEGDELDVLATLVEVHEQRHYPVDAPNPVEFIKNLMEFQGM